ncbi:MAG: hypothetical protein Q9223_003708 [Gallowayella weberi]
MQLIAMRNEFIAFSRRADAKISLLREVIEAVQRGEDVDVRGLLGTGNPEKEKEWEEVIKDVEEEDRLWQANARRREKRDAKRAEGTAEKAFEPANPSIEPSTEIQAKRNNVDGPESTRKDSRGFY